ncbi:MAG TPA: GNAT family N-acetyltransferase [Anaerolineae bacterium]|nr:GNAT family N-acetyltransferase [Anaerolineae bacterium]
MNKKLDIRPLRESDPEIISAAFTKIGWDKPIAQYEQYLEEQRMGSRSVLVATIAGKFAGYVTINWQSYYAPFRAAGIPEIQDFNVLPHFRRRGIGTALLTRAEKLVAQRSSVVGIGVGMHSDYGNAQRLYVKRGYVPDGRGLTYDGRVLKPMENTVNDDDLVLYFTKSLELNGT